MILVDIRNHGNSASLPGFSPPHDMAAAARDVAELIKASHWGSAEMVISHSMGGKVALDFGQKCGLGEYGNVAPPKQVKSASYLKSQKLSFYASVVVQFFSEVCSLTLKLSS
jgi:pimeloyl-ACP methyl ester carboxylesterase